MSSLSRSIARGIARNSTVEAVANGRVKCPGCHVRTLQRKNPASKTVLCKCGWRGRIR